MTIFLRFCFLFSMGTMLPSGLKAQDVFEPQIENGNIELSGFLVAGRHYFETGDASLNQRFAMNSWNEVCSMVLGPTLNQTFDEFRIKNFSCGTIQNYSKHSYGYFPISNASLDLAVDANETYLGYLGAELEHKSYGPDYEDSIMFREFLLHCLDEIQKEKVKYGESYLGADCGEPIITGSFHDKSSLLIKSRVRIYVRQAKATKPLPSNEMKLWKKVQGHAGHVLGFQFANLGNKILPISFDASGHVIMWDLETGSSLWHQSLRDPSPGHPRDERPLLSLGIDPSNRAFLVGGDYGFLQYRKVADGSLISEVRSTSAHGWHYTAVGFGKSGQYGLVVGETSVDYSSNHNIHEWEHARANFRKENNVQIELIDLEAGTVINTYSLTAARVFGVGFTKDESHIFLITAKDVRVLNVLSGNLVYQFKIEDHDMHINEPVILGASFSKSFEYLAVSTLTGVIVLDVETNLPIRGRYKIPDRIRQLSAPKFTTDERSIIASTAFGQTYEWDVLTGALIFYHDSEESSLLGGTGLPAIPITYSPDGKYQIQSYAPGSQFGIVVFMPPVFGTPGIPPAGKEPDYYGLTVLSRY